MANVFRGGRVNREIDEELKAHLDEAMTNGRDPEEARRALGSPWRHRQESRDARLVAWLENVLQDVRYALRTLWKSKRVCGCGDPDAGTGDRRVDRNLQRDRKCAAGAVSLQGRGTLSLHVDSRHTKQ